MKSKFYSTNSWGSDVTWSISHFYIEDLRSYIDEIESWIKHEIFSLDRRYKDLEEKTYGKVAESMQELFAEQRFQIDEIERFLSYGALIVIFATFESLLLEATTFVKNIEHIACKSTGKKKSLCHSFIEEAKEFFKNCGINFPSNTPDWQFIKDFQRVRNCVAHANGRIDDSKDSKKLYSIIKKLNGLDKNELGYITIQFVLLRKLIDAIEKVLEKIWQEIAQKEAQCKHNTT